MKIILDECVPTIVKHSLPHRDVVTVQEMGWSGTKNGQLLELAAAKFDVFMTSDKNLRYQQNLAKFNLAIVLLPTNQVPAILALLPRIDDALASVGENEFVEI